MKILFSIIISLILTVLISYFILFQRLPESLQLNGYINFITSRQGAGGVFGLLIGMSAISFLVIVPFLSNIPNSLQESISNINIKNDPIKTNGQLTSLRKNDENWNLEVIYDNHKKEFEVPNILVNGNLETGSTITVFYDENEPTNAYLDLFDQSTVTENSIKNSDTVFKLIELIPKFEISPNSYELIGEIYGDRFQGQKASITYELEREYLSNLTPGKLYPCHISGNTNNYSISLELN